MSEDKREEWRERARRRTLEDPDYDIEPGNRSMSKEYALRYDAVEQEHSNVLEGPNKREEHFAMLAAAERQKQALADTLADQSRVQFFSVGKFILPRKNTFAAHHELVSHDPAGLGFNPARYPHFDGVIAEESGLRPLYDPSHRDYARYEGLRDNLAVIRNFIFTDAFRDGSFDPGDEAEIPRIAGIAAAIGQGLASDTWLKRAFMPAVNTEIAAIPGEGAAEIYRHLLSQEQQPSPIARLGAWLRGGAAEGAWRLPPLEESPFGDMGLAAPPPEREHCFSARELGGACPERNMQDYLRRREMEASQAGRAMPA